MKEPRSVWGIAELRAELGGLAGEQQGGVHVGFGKDK